MISIVELKVMRLDGRQNGDGRLGAEFVFVGEDSSGYRKPIVLFCLGITDTALACDPFIGQDWSTTLDWLVEAGQRLMKTLGGLHADIEQLRSGQLWSSLGFAPYPNAASQSREYPNWLKYFEYGMDRERFPM